MISEQARHRLYSRLGEVLGSDEAATLMGYLPPLGWGDVATRDDLRLLEARLDAKLADVRGAIASQNRNLFVSMLTLQLTALGLFVAAAHLV